ncbi:unnamed protein product [Linum tenue]|uniref:Uncharacterized protein n=1 Tax=Linum tenue TaxID=586396 RepID=A0AAV0P0S1_9ROSI|nr:unnamed protein product [Linum tenue]CAI0464172.1 unnamed protein product [Linum tenue]
MRITGSVTVPTVPRISRQLAENSIKSLELFLSRANCQFRIVG